MTRHATLAGALLALVVVAPRVSAAQQPPPPAPPRAAATATAAQATPPVSSGALDNTIDAGEAENPTPRPIHDGSEYFFLRADAPASNNPMFHGGEVVGTWLITGETRSYNTRGGYFNQVSPSVTCSTVAPAPGSLSPDYPHRPRRRHADGWQVLAAHAVSNRYLSDNVRFELANGYAVGPLRPRRQDAVLPGANPVPALIAELD